MLLALRPVASRTWQAILPSVRRATRLRSTAALLSIALFSAACATGTGDTGASAIPGPAEAIPSGANAVYSDDGLVLVPTPQLPSARLYVKPPRPHLQRYEKMVLAATTLSYREGTAAWTRRHEDEVLGSFESDLLETLEKGEFWERADRIGADTLVLKATVADLEFDLDVETQQRSSVSATSFVQAGGGAVLGFEIFDSVTQEPLMRFVSRSQLPGGIYSGTEVEEQRLRVLFRRFARELSQVLQAQYRAVKEIERREAVGAPPG